MTTFRRVHVARQRHRCVGCWQGIHAGHTYSRETVTPGDEDGGNTGDRMVTLKGHYPHGTCEQQARDGRYFSGTEQAEVWNSVHPVGADVWYWPHSLPGEGAYSCHPAVRATTKTAAYVQDPGDVHARIFITGVSGFVHLDHLEPVIDWSRTPGVQEHTMETCGCDAGCGCAAWCLECTEADDAKGRRTPNPDSMWPCLHERRRYGVTSVATYSAIDGRLWEEGHRQVVAQDIAAWNAANPVGTPVRHRIPGGLYPAGYSKTAGAAYAESDGHEGVVDVEGWEHPAVIDLLLTATTDPAAATGGPR